MRRSSSTRHGSDHTSTAMRARIAEAIGIDMTAVSIKAKSSEGMGYTGDGTGIAVYAVASVARR